MGPLLEHMPSLTRLSPSSEADALAKLVVRLRASDAALHERALRELLPDVRWWTESLVGNHPEVDDAIQEALTEIARSLHRFEGRSSLRTLARRITVRTVLRHMRRFRRTAAAPLSEDTLQSHAADPEQQAVARAMATRVRAHLGELAPKRRVAFVLCVLEGLSPSEAAAEAGCTGIAMRGRLHHARKELSERLLADEELGADLRGRP